MIFFFLLNASLNTPSTGIIIFFLGGGPRGERGIFQVMAGYSEDGSESVSILCLSNHPGLLGGQEVQRGIVTVLL